jgi:hypothetical protein
LPSNDAARLGALHEAQILNLPPRAAAAGGDRRRKRVEQERERLITELRAALAEVKTFKRPAAHVRLVPQNPR